LSFYDLSPPLVCFYVPLFFFADLSLLTWPSVWIFHFPPATSPHPLYPSFRTTASLCSIPPCRLLPFPRTRNFSLLSIFLMRLLPSPPRVYFLPVCLRSLWTSLSCLRSGSFSILFPPPSFFLCSFFSRYVLGFLSSNNTLTVENPSLSPLLPSHCPNHSPILILVGPLFTRHSVLLLSHGVLGPLPSIVTQRSETRVTLDRLFGKVLILFSF